MKYDYLVIGGGIVGLATAHSLLQRKPGARLLLVEKETRPAMHQTGHNSGVIHAGVYYAPGSLKAELCRAGERATKEFCDANDIAYKTPGKLIVATSELEVERLHALRERARQNGIDIEPVDRARLRELEPDVAGLEALLVPATGIVDFTQISTRLMEQVVQLGGDVRLECEVTGIFESQIGVTVETSQGEFGAERLIACAGLQADRIARLGGLKTNFQIIPFRGEYYQLPAERSTLISHLIYPVPDPDLPFLGVHLSPTIDGRLTVGPNAVLAAAREGYGRLSFNRRDVLEYAAFRGMWKVARANLKIGYVEARNSLWRRGYLAECRKYCPSLRLSDLQSPSAGIRAQAVMADDTLVQDFLFRDSARQLHVANAPSPAATSALPIGDMIADRMLSAGA